MTARASTLRSVRPRRAAVLSVHTSPLDQPGTGDAGGLNVYVVETSKRLAELGVEVEVFTRATSSDLPPVYEQAPGVTVRHLTAGPFEGLSKEDLPAQLCALSSGLLRVEAQHEPGYFDVVHSHYWLSGQVGWLATERWDIPLVHSAHTLAKVKNLALADGDTPEPLRRVIGEQQVVDAADRLVANTAQEARDLIQLYGADAARVLTVAPGVDLEQFRPGEASGARTRLGIPPDAVLLLFVGRLQPLKAPDVLIRAAAELLREKPERRRNLVVAVLGGPSGSGLDTPRELHDLAAAL
ncbi:MAG TPA: glycosyltransferase, partial [Mycobacteriales bacterium]|nr:glycosyltransferase [Mycobacteriales bacterium]